MPGLEVRYKDYTSWEEFHSICSGDLRSNFVLFFGLGPSLESTISSSLNNMISLKSAARGDSTLVSFVHRELEGLGTSTLDLGASVMLNGGFMSMSLRSVGFVGEQMIHMSKNGDNKNSDEEAKLVGSIADSEDVNKKNVNLRGYGAMNTTKHLWSGAVAAIISRTILAPLERLKLEYILHDEQRNLYELVRTIAASQGLKGFWRGNLVNILRTAPFKAVNFCAYDSYRKQLLRLSRNEETTNFERFIAGAAAGITATIICLPLDTIRTRMVAPGGESLGSVAAAFAHLIRSEGFFSLYKGLVPSIISMAPAGAVFYGVYDILKTAFLHSPHGRMRREQKARKSSTLDQLELGPMRTLLYGAVSGACAEAATYPFEVVRRRLQMQVRANRLSAFKTVVGIVEQGGVSALYAGLFPSLLQVLPSAAISYFIYECMKILLEVE